MKANEIKQILPKAIKGLEYKDYPVALVLDTIKNLTNINHHKAADIVDLVDKAIRYIQSNNQVHLMALTSKQRYRFWTTVMELVKHLVCNYRSLKNHSGKNFGIIAPRSSFFCSTSHPVAGSLGYTSPERIGSFITHYFLEDIVLTITDPTNQVEHNLGVQFQDYSLLRDYSTGDQSIKLKMLSGSLISDGLFIDDLTYLLNGIRFMGLVGHDGRRCYDAEYTVADRVYKVHIE